MKKKKELVFINVDHVGLQDTKPSRDIRPKCMNCEKSILMRKTWWYDGSEGYKKSPAKFYYDGIGYFCCRQCAQQYGTEAARKVLGHPEFNSVK